MRTPSRSPVVLRPLTTKDLAAAHGLTRAIGWPHRREDWALALRLGSGVAAEEDGRLIGTALRWTYGAADARIGMIVVAPSDQSRGLGRRLTQAALRPLRHRSVTLHGTPAGLSLYASLGFETVGVVRQLQGAAFRPGVPALRAGERLRPIGRSDPAVLAALDRAATGSDRSRVLAALLQARSGVVLDRAGTIRGFALLRRFGHGLLIGPVEAPDAASAKAMILHHLGSHAGQFIRIDVPEETGLVAWLLRLGLADAGTVTFMRKGVAPPSHRRGQPRVYALMSQALG
ncbi:MAG: GNAT family N-acetyltransferase [Rhodospirillales bacterium]|nr:GNAT family N-acetyltransferase [Rhodospirillales bacterium]